MSRPSKAVVLQLLAAKGQDVTLTQHDLIEDVDGDPAGVTIKKSTGFLAVSPELLGWTQAELDNPEVTE